MAFYRKTIQIMIFFVCCFLLCGFLHFLLWSVPFTIGISQLLCGSLTLFWALSVRRRVTDPRLCRLLLCITFFLVLYYSLQFLRYPLPVCAIRRWIWYAYYIPMMAIPLLCFYLSLFIHRPPDERLKKRWILPAAAGTLLTAGILTNDLHFLAFSSSDGILSGRGDEQLEILYYLFFSFVVLSLVSSYIIVLRKSRRSATGDLLWLPPVLLLSELIYLLADYKGLSPRIHGIIMWNIGEVFGFFTITFLEICIQIGLIPSNRDYEKLFSLAGLSAIILDMNQHPVYQTRMTVYPFPENEDTRIISHPISGGSIQWSIDIHSLRLLNEQLRKTIQQIDARNNYLENENTLREESAKLETQNHLYNRISEIISPQIHQIHEILRDIRSPLTDTDPVHSVEDNLFEQQLPRIAFLTAYIKRRSNMELISDNNCLPSAELEMAVRELLEYLQLSGINTAVTVMGNQNYSSALVTEAFEKIETILEDCLETLTDLMVVLRAEPGCLTIRMMLRSSSFSFEADGSTQKSEGFSFQFSVIKDDPDLILLLTFTEEGDV